MAVKGLSRWIHSPFEKREPFLKQIPREAADFFILKSQISEYESGDLIISAGEKGENFYVLQSGSVQICGSKQGEGYSRVAVLDKGACFGEMSVLSDDPVSNTVVALEESTILRMQKKDFVRFISDNPGVLILLYKILSERLRIKNEEVESGGGSSATDTPLSGDFSVVPFVDIAQAFEKSYITGVVHVGSKEGEGQVAFDKGRLVFCSTTAHQADDAIEEVLSWTDARFRFTRGETPSGPANMAGDTTAILLDALRRQDEKKN